MTKRLSIKLTIIFITTSFFCLEIKASRETLDVSKLDLSRLKRKSNNPDPILFTPKKAKILRVKNEKFREFRKRESCQSTKRALTTKVKSKWGIPKNKVYRQQSLTLKRERSEDKAPFVKKKQRQNLIVKKAHLQKKKIMSCKVKTEKRD